MWRCVSTTTDRELRGQFDVEAVGPELGPRSFCGILIRPRVRTVANCRDGFDWARAAMQEGRPA